MLDGARLALWEDLGSAGRVVLDPRAQFCEHTITASKWMNACA